MKEGVLCQKLPNKQILCLACQRKCTITSNAVGFCLARKNVGGKLFSLLDGYTTGIQIDPIEKKPFYHFKPGSLVATIGSIGCNFRCKQCLNYEISWGASLQTTDYRLQLTDYRLQQKTAKEIAKEIINAGYNGMAFSYNEPVIWAEFAATIAKEFKSRLSPPPQLIPDPQPTSHNSPQYAVFVTNGSWTKETIDLLSSPPQPTPDTQHTTHPHPLIDAANIDLKGFSKETYRKQGAFFGQIPAMATYAQKKGIFIELTTLLIPGINDDPEEIKKMTAWIAKNLGPETPWHLSQFDPGLAPDKDFQKIPLTPIEDLEKAAAIGKKAGLNHVYIWAPASKYARSDTICPQCHKTVIHRNGWQVLKMNITPEGKCEFCHHRLNVVL